MTSLRMSSFGGAQNMGVLDTLALDLDFLSLPAGGRGRLLRRRLRAGGGRLRLLW